MKWTKSVVLSVLVLFLAVGCSKKPCKGIPVPAAIKATGIVLPGGRLCKNGRGVASFDFPEESKTSIIDKYAKALPKSNWTVEKVSSYAILATKKASDALLLIFGKSKKRRVTFAIVKYCSGFMKSACVSRITKLGKALKKVAKK